MLYHHIYVCDICLVSYDTEDWIWPFSPSRIWYRYIYGKVRMLDNIIFRTHKLKKKFDTKLNFRF